jgi:hypothetical protein
VHPFEGLGAVDFFEELELKKQGFEVGAGEAELDAADAAGELQAAGMFGRWLKEAFETGAEVGGAADVGFGVGVCAMEGEDCGGVGQLGERGYWIGWVEGKRMQRD